MVKDLALSTFKFIVAIFCASLLFYGKCIKKEDCQNNNYAFSIAAKVFPDLDSLRLGSDTVFIEVREAVALTNLNSANTINFSGANNLGSVIPFEELLGNGATSFVANSFELIVYKGTEKTSSDQRRFREFLFAEESGFYLFKIGLIPKKRGIFRIGLSGANNVSTRTNPCERSHFSVVLKETNQHLYYNQWNFGVTPALPNGTYCFKVY